MAVIETKYSVGDKVYQAHTETTVKLHPCPDCLGTGKWRAISPAGTEYSFSCVRCNTSFVSRDDLSLKYTAHVPCTRQLTIGSVRYNSYSHPASFDEGGAEYMCVETGVGGGSVYKERTLLPTEAEAFAYAETLAAKANEGEWTAKLYDKTLEISDYQLESAALKSAADKVSEARSLLWGLNELFDQIGEAEGIDEVGELVDDYKRYRWERDKAAARLPSISREG